MILTRAQCFHTVARRLTMPTGRVSAASFVNTNRAASSSSTPPSSGDMKVPFKVVPLEVKNPEDYNGMTFVAQSWLKRDQRDVYDPKGRSNFC